MSELASHLRQMQKSFESDAWHGPALLETLEGVDHRLAAKHVAPGVHTIWEIALHTIAWKRAVTRWLEGDTSYEVKPEENFPEPEEGDFLEWQHVITELKVAQAELLAATAKFTDERLLQTTPSGRQTWSDLLYGVVHHDLYHAGQIALLKKTAAHESQGSRFK
ncbi:DinB family protein [bacterium]|nr:DinB family protein [bacterium]